MGDDKRKSGSVLVTGGTGFTGGHLCRHLRNAGHEVRALVRPGSDVKSLSAMGVQPVTGDLLDVDSLRRATRGVDVVYHIAAAFRDASLPDRVFFDVNVRGTENLIRAAGTQGVQRFVHCSTIGVHGDTGFSPATEDSPIRPPDVYCESKVAGEAAARRLFEELGLPGVVFRPMGIYGPGDGRFLKLFRSIRRGTFLMIGSGQVWYQLTYIDDLCRGIMLCGEHPAAVGEVFILAGDTHTTLNELVACIAKEVGGRVPRWHVPLAPVMLAAGLCEGICRPLGLNPPLYRRRVEFFSKNRAADNARARALIGFRPVVDLPTGIARTAEWYRENGWL